MSPLLKPGSPDFSPPKPAVKVVPPPQDLRDDLAAGRKGVARAYLEGAEIASAGRIDAIVVIPKDFAPGAAAPAEYWASTVSAPSSSCAGA